MSTWAEGLLLGMVAIGSLGAQAQEADLARHWNFADLQNPPSYRENPFPESDYLGLKAMLVKGKGPNGSEAEFFAYYGFPVRKMPKGGFPAVLLVHGGGGTAYPQYATRWINSGFAVLSLDWHNTRPAPGLTNVPPSEVSVPRGSMPGGRRNDVQANVANIVLASSLLRSFPEVDSSRTVYVGLSWGSWYGTAVAALDPRFRGFVEIYCGDVNPKRNNLVDGRFLPLAKSPMWWVVSTNDRAVTPLTSNAGWQACAKLAGHAIVNDLPHSHEGFDFEGCVLMARHFALGTKSLPVLGPAEVKNGRLVAKITNVGTGVDHAKVAWTGSLDPETYKRHWFAAVAEIDGDVVSAQIPDGAVQAYLSVYGDDEGHYGELCGSSQFVILKE